MNNTQIKEVRIVKKGFMNYNIEVYKLARYPFSSWRFVDSAITLWGAKRKMKKLAKKHQKDLLGPEVVHKETFIFKTKGR